MTKGAKSNPQRGSSIDDFLKEDGIFEKVQSHATERAWVEQMGDTMPANSAKASDSTRAFNSIEQGLNEAVAHAQTKGKRQKPLM